MLVHQSVMIPDVTVHGSCCHAQKLPMDVTWPDAARARRLGMSLGPFGCFNGSWNMIYITPWECNCMDNISTYLWKSLRVPPTATPPRR